MFKVAVCDDELHYRDRVSTKIREIFSERDVDVEIKTYTNGELLLKSPDIEQGLYDAVFLDIEMPGRLGLDIAKAIRKKNIDTLIIFVTSFDRYVFDVFDYDVVAYVRKSEMDQRLPAVVDRVIEKVRTRNSEYVFKNQNGQYSVCPDEILYFESIGHKISVCRTDGSVIKVTHSLGQLEIEFARYRFIRTHAGFLVNMKYVYSIENETVLLTTGRSIPLSRHRSKEVRKIFFDYMRNK